MAVKKSIICSWLMFAAFIPTSIASSLGYHPSLEPYVGFLKKHHDKPVDYVMRLFETHDIVILCERNHPETTQYDFIFDLVSDKRFVNTVGHVFTEIGTSSLRSEVNQFLLSNHSDDSTFELQLRHISQNLTDFPIWEKHSYYDFLRRIYTLNRTLPLDRRIHVYPSDRPFSWKGMTKDKYKQFRNTSAERDAVMVKQIIQSYEENSLVGKKSKILLIMNYRHAFNDFVFDDGGKGDNVGRYLFERYPGRVANVLINTLTVLPGSTDAKTIQAPVQDGKWDAAFAVMGNKMVGFDFSRSPFGTDSFDLFSQRFRKHHVKYQDVFTGFVFYKPLDEHKYQRGVPEAFGDHEFEKELIRRFAMTDTDFSDSEIKDFIEKNKRITESGYPENPEFRRTVQKWLNTEAGSASGE